MIMATANSKRPQAAVIGAGFGGIAAAIRLQAAGFETTIYEKRDMAGGRAYTFKDNGYTFDAGPTVVTAPNTVEELFHLTGTPMQDYVELIKVDPLYRLFWEDGTVFNYTDDMTKTIEQMRKLNPEDAEGYKKFSAYAKEVFHEGYTKLGHVPFMSFWSMLRCAPQLMRLEAYRSVYSIVSKFIKSEHIRQAFSFHTLLVGGNPFNTSAIYTLIHQLEKQWGVYFAKGGTGAMVAGLVKYFEKLGGKIVLNAEIDEIATSGGKATGLKLRDGTFAPADLVVSNAEVMHTYRKLLRSEPTARKTERRLDRMSYSMSLFLIYFGTNKNWDNIAHHNVIFGARYKELLKEIFKNNKNRLPDDFSLYLHAPSKTDPSVAPPGKHAYYVLSPVAHLGNLDIDWTKEGPKYADRILGYLESRYMPGLRASIETQRIFTPKDFETELNSHLGAAFSIQPVLQQSAYFRVHNRDDQISNLYFVGAGTHPGAGIPGVIGSAKATAGVILEDFKDILPKYRSGGAVAAGPQQPLRSIFPEQHV